MNVDGIISRFKLHLDRRFSERQKKLAVYEMVLDGSVYDNLPPFCCEYDGEGGKYVRLIDRAPSVRYKLSKIIVNEVASMMFGEGHFPQVKCDEQNHEDTANTLKDISKRSSLPLVMINAVKSGCVGSVAIVVKLCENKFIFEVLKTKYLYPVFYDNDPARLSFLLEKRYFQGKQLVEMGYDINKEKLNAQFCLQRNWDENSEIYFQPFLVSDEEEAKSKNIVFTPSVDEEKTTYHNLGCVPVVWIKNPDEDEESDCDGKCIFEDIIDNCFEIDYQLSQHGRLLKYNSDPTLVIKDPGRLEGDTIVKGIGSIMLGAEGDAKFLQLTDGATKSVIEYVKHLRQISLEVIRGDRSNPEKINSGHSGRALQMLNKPLISLVNELKICYGEIGLINIYKIMMKMLMSTNIDHSISFSFEGYECIDHLSLSWPPFYTESEQDISLRSKTLETLTTNGIISKKTATQSVSSYFDIDDIESEEKQIEEDKQELEALQPQVKESINI